MKTTNLYLGRSHKRLACLGLTHCVRLSGFRQHPLRASPFLWVRGPGFTGPSAQGLAGCDGGVPPWSRSLSPRLTWLLTQSGPAAVALGSLLFFSGGQPRFLSAPRDPCSAHHVTLSRTLTAGGSLLRSQQETLSFISSFSEGLGPC